MELTTPESKTPSLRTESPADALMKELVCACWADDDVLAEKVLKDPRLVITERQYQELCDISREKVWKLIVKYAEEHNVPDHFL